MKKKGLIALFVPGALALVFVVPFPTLSKDPGSSEFKSSYFLLVNDSLQFPLEKDYKLSCTGVNCSITLYKKEGKEHARIKAFLAIAKAPKQALREEKEELQTPEKERKKMPQGAAYKKAERIALEELKPFSCKGNCSIETVQKGGAIYQKISSLAGSTDGPSKTTYYK